MRNEDNEIIKRSEFAVKSGMLLELTIVMRQRTALQNHKKCPRCNHPNLDVAPRHGWIDWQVCWIHTEIVINTDCSYKCPLQFQVSTIDKNHERNGEIYNGGRGGTHDSECGREGAEVHREDDTYPIQKIISPMPYVTWLFLV